MNAAVKAIWPILFLLFSYPACAGEGGLTEAGEVILSYGTLNGSKMALVGSDNDKGIRKIIYIVPRKRMIEEGVRPGTVYFSGRREDAESERSVTYIGEARLFSKACRPLKYAVVAKLVSDAGRISIVGDADVRDQDCRVTGKVRHIVDVVKLDQCNRPLGCFNEN